MNKQQQQISVVQLGMLMFPTVMITAVLLVPAVTSREAGRDMWLSPIWASLSGIAAAYLAWKLHTYFKQKTIIEYSTDIVGVVPGKLIGFIYIFFYLHVNSLVLIQYSHFVVGYFLNETPVSVIIICMVIVSAFCVRGGVEVMARSSQLITPFIIIFIMFIFLFLMPDLEYKNLLPIMGQGISPSIKGAFVPMGWFSHFFAISFFLPYISSKSKVLKGNTLTVIIVALSLTTTNLFALMLFDMSVSSYTYPVWSATRYISLGGFEHVEALVMSIWVAGVFIKVSVFYYILAMSTAQWFQLKNYKPLVFPLGFILIAFSLLSFPTLDELSTFLSKIIPYYQSIVGIGIPFIMLMIVLLKNISSGKRS